LSPSPGHVLFDFDGTLVDSLRLVMGLYNGLATERGWPLLTDDFLPKLRQLPLRERLTALGVPLLRLPFLGREIRRRYAVHIGSLTPIAGIPEALGALAQRRLTLGIVSSNSVPNIERFLQTQALPHFSSVESVPGLWGKHRTLRRYLAIHRLSPSQVIYVGDEVRDLVAARRAGLRAVAVTWGADLESMLGAHQPAGLVRHPSELDGEIVRLLDLR
jgi:phosphoglycolate phosphatase